MRLPPCAQLLAFIWLISTILNTVEASKAVDIYIDGNSATQKSNGTKEFPFTNFQDAFNYLNNISLTSVDLSLHLMAGDAKYSADVPLTTFTNDNISSFSISAWDDTGSISSFEDCAALPEVDFTNINLRFMMVPTINISSISMVYSGSSIIIMNSKSIMMKNLCLTGNGEDQNYFIRTQNTHSFTMQNIQISLSYGKSIISYINGFVETEDIQTTFQDISIRLKSSSDDQDDQVNPKNMIFKFMTHTENSFLYSSNYNAQNLTVTGISIETEEEDQIVPTIAKFSGWDNIFVDGVTFQNQKCSFGDAGLFIFSESNTLHINNTAVSGNTIRTDSNSTSNNGAAFLVITDVSNFAVSNTDFSENTVFFQDQEVSFSFMNLTNTQQFTLSNYSVNSNQLDTYTYIINFDTQFITISSLQLALTNLDINNNSIPSTFDFYFIKFQLNTIQSFSIENLHFTNNQLTGRLFYFEAIAKTDNPNASPTFLNMTGLTIDSNPSLVNFALVFLSVTNPYKIASDFVYPSEFYSIVFRDMNVTNNTFSKTTSTDYLETESLIQVAGSQVYLEGCQLVSNKFINSDFVALERQISSVFLINSNVIDNNFTNGSLINTQYELLTITRGSFKNQADNSVEVMYRFAVIFGSNFSQINVKGSTLFILNNAFLIFSTNSLDRIIFENACLLSGGRFQQPFSDLSPSTNSTSEILKNNIMAVNPSMIQLFDQMRENEQWETPVLFYQIFNNNFTNFQISSDALIDISEYSIPRSGVYIHENVLRNCNFTRDLSSIFSLKDSTEIDFQQNTIEYIYGVGKIVSISIPGRDQTRFFFIKNTIAFLRGPSFLTYIADSITQLIITDNDIISSNFNSTAIDIQIALNDGKINLSRNRFYNNILSTQDNGLYVKSSFISFTTNYASGNQTLQLEDLTFDSNRYENGRSFSQFGQLSAFISLLLANSSVNIYSSNFTNTSISSIGTSMFYIAANTTNIRNCSFTNSQMSSGKSILNIQSLTTNLMDNTFENMTILADEANTDSAGLISLNSKPYISGSLFLNVQNSTFTNCIGSNGNVLSIESSQLILVMDNNTFTDSFGANGMVKITNTNCIDCAIYNSQFNIISAGSGKNAFLNLGYIQGNVQLVNLAVRCQRENIISNVFVRCTNSPSVNILIDKFSWNAVSDKNTLQLANIESGNLLISNVALQGLRYDYNDDQADGYLIQLVGNNASNIHLRNLNLSKFTFNNYPAFDQDPTTKAALIRVIGSSQANQAELNITLEDCIFDAISGATGLYINLPMTYSANIMNCTFRNNKNYEAPALDFYENSQTSSSHINIQHSTFTNNSADIAGGAIAINGTNYTINNSSFIGNSAGDLGGGILFKNISYDPSILQFNRFNNSADKGNNIGLPITQIGINPRVSPDSSMSVLDTLPNIPMVKGAKLTTSSDIQLIVNFLDELSSLTMDYDQGENPSLTVNFVNQSIIYSQNCSKFGCTIDKLGVQLVGIGLNVTAKVTYTASSTRTYSGEFMINLRNCEDGEYANERTSFCDLCPRGTYSLATNQTCTTCPLNADCPGGNQLNPRENFWRVNSSDVILPCNNDAGTRCYGTLNPSTNTFCAQGFKGPLCEQCDFDNDYVESGFLNCTKCTNVNLSLFLSILAGICYFVFKIVCVARMYLTNMTFCSDEEQDNYTLYKTSESGYYVRLIVVYSQVLSMVYLANSEVRDWFGFVSQIGNPSEFILVDLQCSMKAIGVSADQFIYMSTIIIVFSPFVQFILISLLVMLLGRRPSSTIRVSQFIWLTFIYIIILEQPGIVGYLTSYLSCSDLAQNNKDYYITMHPNWKCEGTQYQFYKYALVIPFLCLWVIIVPICMFIGLFAKRGRLGEKEVRSSYGSLYNLYKPKYYYWGTIIMLLELVLSFTSYAFEIALKLRIFILFILLWIYQFAVRQLKPYTYSKFNSTESMTFSLLMLNIILTYLTTIEVQYNDVLRSIAYGILIVLNLAMSLYLGWKLFDLTLMRLFDLIVDKINNFRQKRSARMSARSGRSLGSMTSDNSEFGRSESVNVENFFKNRPSYDPRNPEESFVM